MTPRLFATLCLTIENEKLSPQAGGVADSFTHYPMLNSAFDHRRQDLRGLFILMRRWLQAGCPPAKHARRTHVIVRGEQGGFCKQLFVSLIR